MATGSLAIVADYEDEDTEPEDNTDLDWQVQGNHLRGNFTLSHNGQCPRCQTSKVLFVILDELYPTGDMPETLCTLIAKGQAVLWSSQDKKGCEAPPTFLCRGFCPSDPLGAGFNVNWSNVTLNDIFFSSKSLAKSGENVFHSKQGKSPTSNTRTQLSTTHDIEAFQDVQAKHKVSNDDETMDNDNTDSDDDDDDLDEDELIKQMLAKEALKTQDTETIECSSHLTNTTEAPTAEILELSDPLRTTTTVYSTTPEVVKVPFDQSYLYSSFPPTQTTITPALCDATHQYPVSSDGRCPYCYSNNVKYIIVFSSGMREEDLPHTLCELLKRQQAFKMAKGLNDPPSFQCQACNFGFNLDWSLTNLELIFGIAKESNISIAKQPVLPYSLPPPMVHPPGFAPPFPQSPGIAPPGLPPPGLVPPGVPPPRLGPPRLAPPTLPPPRIPGLAPPGLAPGVPPPRLGPPPRIPHGILPPRVTHPSIPPPGLAPPGLSPPGIPPPRVSHSSIPPPGLAPRLAPPGLAPRRVAPLSLPPPSIPPPCVSPLGIPPSRIPPLGVVPLGVLPPRAGPPPPVLLPPPAGLGPPGTFPHVPPRMFPSMDQQAMYHPRFPPGPPPPPPGPPSAAQQPFLPRMSVPQGYPLPQGPLHTTAPFGMPPQIYPPHGVYQNYGPTQSYPGHGYNNQSYTPQTPPVPPQPFAAAQYPHPGAAFPHVPPPFPPPPRNSYYPPKSPPALHPPKLQYHKPTTPSYLEQPVEVKDTGTSPGDESEGHGKTKQVEEAQSLKDSNRFEQLLNQIDQVRGEELTSTPPGDEGEGHGKTQDVDEAQSLEDSNRFEQLLNQIDQVRGEELTSTPPGDEGEGHGKTQDVDEAQSLEDSNRFEQLLNQIDQVRGEELTSTPPGDEGEGHGKTQDVDEAQSLEDSNRFEQLLNQIDQVRGEELTSTSPGDEGEGHGKTQDVDEAQSLEDSNRFEQLLNQIDQVRGEEFSQENENKKQEVLMKTLEESMTEALDSIEGTQSFQTPTETLRPTPKSEPFADAEETFTQEVSHVVTQSPGNDSDSGEDHFVTPCQSASELVSKTHTESETHTAECVGDDTPKMTKKAPTGKRGRKRKATKKSGDIPAKSEQGTQQKVTDESSQDNEEEEFTIEVDVKRRYTREPRLGTHQAPESATKDFVLELPSSVVEVEVTARTAQGSQHVETCDFEVEMDVAAELQPNTKVSRSNARATRSRGVKHEETGEETKSTARPVARRSLRSQDVSSEMLHYDDDEDSSDSSTTKRNGRPGQRSAVKRTTAASEIIKTEQQETLRTDEKFPSESEGEVGRSERSENGCTVKDNETAITNTQQQTTDDASQTLERTPSEPDLEGSAPIGRRGRSRRGTTVNDSAIKTEHTEPQQKTSEVSPTVRKISTDEESDATRLATGHKDGRVRRRSAKDRLKEQQNAVKQPSHAAGSSSDTDPSIASPTGRRSGRALRKSSASETAPIEPLPAKMAGTRLEDMKTSTDEESENSDALTTRKRGVRPQKELLGKTKATKAVESEKEQGHIGAASPVAKRQTRRMQKHADSASDAEMDATKATQVDEEQGHIGAASPVAKRQTRRMQKHVDSASDAEMDATKTTLVDEEQGHIGAASPVAKRQTRRTQKQADSASDAETDATKATLVDEEQGHIGDASPVTKRQTRRTQKQADSASDAETDATKATLVDEEQGHIGDASPVTKRQTRRTQKQADSASDAETDATKATLVDEEQGHIGDASPVTKRQTRRMQKHVDSASDAGNTEKDITDETTKAKRPKNTSRKHENTTSSADTDSNTQVTPRTKRPRKASSSKDEAADSVSADVVTENSSGTDMMDDNTSRRQTRGRATHQPASPANTARALRKRK